MQKSIAVVGAGIVGVSTAEWLRRDGHQVTLIDRIPPGARGQASFGNAGLLARCAVAPVPYPGIWRKGPAMLLDPNQPLFLRWSYLPRLLPWLVPFLNQGRADRVRHTAKGLAHLNLDTVQQHRALAEGTPAQAYIRDSDYAFVYKSRKDFEKDAFSWTIKQEVGIQGEALEGQALRAWDPNLSPAYHFAYRMQDHGYITNPGAYVKALADWFQAQGGRFICAEVHKLDANAESVRLDLGEQQLAFDGLVLAIGAFSDSLSHQLGIKARIEAERGYHLLLKNPSHMPPHPVMVADGKFVATPMEEGLRIAGVVEFGGPHAPMSEAPLNLLRRYIKQTYPTLTWEEEIPWVGSRPASIDSLPLLGPHPKLPHVYFAAGHHHVGLTGGPKTGRIIADMIAGRRSNLDLSAFRPERFTPELTVHDTTTK